MGRAYGALTEVVMSLHELEILHLNEKLFPCVMSKLKEIVQLEDQMLSLRDRQKILDLQQYFCGVLNAIINKVNMHGRSKPFALNNAFYITSMLEKVLRKNTTEDALSCLMPQAPGF